MSKVVEIDMSIAKNKPKTSSLNNAKPQMSCVFCDRYLVVSSHKVLGETADFIWMENKYKTMKELYQTVLIETMQCNHSFSDYSLEYMEALLNFAWGSRDELLTKGYKDVLFFKSQGYQASCSMRHSHMQLIGLNEEVDKAPFLDSLDNAHIIEQNDSLKVTLSSVPLTEGYEFNLEYSKHDTPKELYSWIQAIILSLPNLEPSFEDYNMVFQEVEDKRYLKVIPRKPASILYLGYGLKVVPSCVSETIEKVRNTYISSLVIP